MRLGLGTWVGLRALEGCGCNVKVLGNKLARQSLEASCQTERQGLRRTQRKWNVQGAYRQGCVTATVCRSYLGGTTVEFLLQLSSNRHETTGTNESGRHLSTKPQILNLNPKPSMKQESPGSQTKHLTVNAELRDQATMHVIATLLKAF